MTLTLLLDLDDTLLTNPIEAFLEAYLKAFSRHLDGKIAPDQFVRQLLAATKTMVQNDDHSQTLEASFDAAFYPAVGLEKAELREIIASFYEEVFPTLRKLTTPRPEAVRLVEWAFEKGFRVVVATNPLFPRTAILQRLAWADLPPEQYPFDLITSYETFHFAKPNPAFFSEVMAQIGWPVGPAVMVGNSLKDDILPAAKAGLLTYYLHEQEPAPEGLVAATGPGGRLEDLPIWLETLELENDPASITEPEAAISALKATPAALGTLTKDLTPEEWKAHPLAGEWGITEIACHLRDVEGEVHLFRLTRILEETNPFLAGEDTDAWAEDRKYRRQNGPFALAKFTDCRNQTISILKNFQPLDWERITRHAIFGPTTVKE
ncbi:MAG TPA: HAD family hydrolase, partial [Anaerolineaceae bacterium]|nr:HAD family hydrolase [Anaerolineaceae bacterium]